jgi:hypothetical protein
MIIKLAEDGPNFLERRFYKGGGGKAAPVPAPAPPIPPVAERGGDTQFAKDEEMRAAARRRGNKSTIMAGASRQQSNAAYGSRSLLGETSN